VTAKLGRALGLIDRGAGSAAARARTLRVKAKRCLLGAEARLRRAGGRTPPPPVECAEALRAAILDVVGGLGV
jgi:hypothetical protein